MSRKLHWLILFATLGLLSACNSDALPTCRDACLVYADQLDSLQLDRGHYSLYVAKEADPVYDTEDLDQALRALEAQRKARRQRSALGAQALYLRCTARTPQSDLQALLNHPEQRDLSLLGLGGQRHSEVSFAALGIWRGDRLQRALDSGEVRHLEPGQQPEACPLGAKACPIWLVRLDPKASCGDLMQELERAAAQRILLGLAM